MAENILDTLKKLHALTYKPEGREEEARTAAWLLIKKARENGVQLRFVLDGKVESAEQDTRPSAAASAPTPSRVAACQKCGSPIYMSFAGCVTCSLREAEARFRAEPVKRASDSPARSPYGTYADPSGKPKPKPDDFESLQELLRKMGF